MKLVGNVQLIAGNSATIAPLLELLETVGIQTHGNPDLYVREYASFGVDEARELALRASSRAISSERRVFIVVVSGMTIEAQNALLKTLEEPAAYALFFFVVPSPQMLLPTLRSRAQVLHVETGAHEHAIDARLFLRSSPAERLALLKPLLEKDDDDVRNLAPIIGFLNDLETSLANGAVSHRQALESVYRARKYMGDKGSLTKALLEQVALLM
jgi:DNA polymerase III delta subunit-like protein